MPFYVCLRSAGLLRIGGGNKAEESPGHTLKGATEASGTPDASIQASDSGGEEYSSGSPGSSVEDNNALTGDKRLEQGWIWGWGSPEDLQDATSAGQVPDIPTDARPRPNIPSKELGDLSRSWRARAAQAMSRKLREARQQQRESERGEAASERPTVPSAAATNMQSPQQPCPELGDTNCDSTRRLILFFLIQTFTVCLYGSSGGRHASPSVFPIPLLGGYAVGSLLWWLPFPCLVPVHSEREASSPHCCCFIVSTAAPAAP